MASTGQDHREAAPRAAITGAAGFIGSALARKAAAAGFTLRLIDNLTTGRLENLGELKDRLQRADVRDVATLEVDSLFHLAAQVSVTLSVSDPAADASTNVVGTISATQAALRGGAKTVIFTSSCALYGDHPPVPTPESTPARPSSPYGLAKWVGEEYVSLLSVSANARAVSLAPANVYGPRQRSDGEGGVVSIFLSRMIRQLDTTIFGDGLQTRDFVYVEDVADAFLAAESHASATGRFNIGTAIPTTILELWEICAAATRYTGSPTFRPSRPGEIRQSTLDASRASAELDWRASVALGEGITATADWFLRESRDS